MKHEERRLAAVGLILLVIGSYGIWASHGSKRDTVYTDVCRTPLSILEPSSPRQIGSAIVFHGLSANRRIMQTFGQGLAALGLRVYLVDSPGHGDSTERFTFARAEKCAGDLIEVLARRAEINPDTTALAGHSMGGAIAIRLADRLPTAATIAISPAPMIPGMRVPFGLVPYSLPRRMPVNLLVFSGGWEPSLAREPHQGLIQAAGGERLQPEDFRQRRAAKLVVIPEATHVSLLFDRRVKDWSADWVRHALNISETQSLPAVGLSHGFPVAGGLLGLLGLLLLFPALTTGLTALFGPSPAETLKPPLPTIRTLTQWTVAALFSVAVLYYWVPLKALRMFNGDYLASFLLIAGLALLLLVRRETKGTFQFEARAAAMACVLGLIVMVAVGAWLNWQLTDAWMTVARWMRWIPLVFVALPYHLAEELALGAPRESDTSAPQSKRKGPVSQTAEYIRRRRMVLFLAVRLVLWLALLFALFAFRSGQILVPLLAVYLVLFSLLQRLGMDAVRQRTGSITAAALFGAILAAWFVAAVFPLA